MATARSHVGLTTFDATDPNTVFPPILPLRPRAGAERVRRVGHDADYWPRGNEFNGTIEWVQLPAGTDDQDHLIGPAERFNVAMAKQ